MVICLERGADLHMAQLMPLPLTCLLNDGNRTWHGEFSGGVSVCCVCCDAVVNHIGARAIGGHYIVDVFHPGYNCWVRCDDNLVSSVPTANVTKFTSPKVPYLIFYRRLEPS